MWKRAAGIFALCFGLLFFSAPATPVTDDAARDLLFARDCTDLARCHTMGAPTSVHGFRQGALWIDLIVAVRQLGGDVEAVRLIVITLNALALTILYVVARRIREDIALPATMLALALIVASDMTPRLINPSTAPIAGVLCFAAMLAYMRDRKLRYLVAASAALAMGVNLHVGAIVLLPALVYVDSVGSTVGILIAAVAFVAIGLVTSWDAWAENFAELGRQHSILIAAAGVLVAGFALRRFRSHAWTIGAASLLPFGGGTAWLLVKHHGFDLTYLHPILAPLAIGVMALLPRVRTLPWIVSGALLVFAVREANRLRDHDWTFERARKVSTTLADQGWTFADLVARKDGCHDIVTGLMPYIPSKSAHLVAADAPLYVPFSVDGVRTCNSTGLVGTSPKFWSERTRLDAHAIVNANEKVAITPALAPRFEELMHRVQAGEAGADITNVNISLDHDRAHLDLLHRDGSRSGFQVTQKDTYVGATNALPARTKIFVIAPDPNARPGDLAPLAALLDREFSDDPFVPESDGMDARDATHGSLTARGVSALVLLHLVALVAIIAIVI